MSETAPTPYPTSEPMGRRWWSAVPDGVLAFVFGLLAVDPWLDGTLSVWWMSLGHRPLDLNHPAIIAILMVEVGFLLPQLTLTDLATRLKKRPPWWLIPPLAIGLLILAPGGMDFLRVLLANQAVLLVPALWSVFHRAKQLWDMPGQPRLVRMRVRALTNGRANIGGLLVVLYLASNIARTSGVLPYDSVLGPDLLITWFATIYFLACAFDAWRVGGEAFARSPRPLLWFDYIDVKDTDAPL